MMNHESLKCSKQLKYIIEVQQFKYINEVQQFLYISTEVQE